MRALPPPSPTVLRSQNNWRRRRLSNMRQRLARNPAGNVAAVVVGAIPVPRAANLSAPRLAARPLQPAGPLARPTLEEHAAPPVEPATSEGTPETPSAPSLRGRYGDPGLASRLTQLEMNFRRLLASAPTPIDAADKAPAGPGVWVLTDSDLTTYYYVEPCQTLRVAIPNLLRGGAARRGGESIRPRLAEHLGIPETRVAKYLGDHCVVRWLQMDEDAAHFAHFLIAVLRPALNE